MSHKRSLRTALLLAVGLLIGVITWPAHATPEDWEEAEAPPPPAWRKEGLIPIDMPIRSNLRFGVDPTTLNIGPDWVVRYVVVAFSEGGSVNAIYEGMNCDSGSVKTYARSSEPGKWNVVAKPTWRELDPTQNATRHSLALARQGVCEGRFPGGRTPAELVQRLKAQPQDPQQNP